MCPGVNTARLLFTRTEALHLRATSLARDAADEQGGERSRLLAEAAEAYEAALGSRAGGERGSAVPGAGSFASWSGLGAVRLAQGRSRDAAACFGRALLSHPGDRDARLGLAEIQLAAGRAAGALVVLERLLDERPDGWVLAAAASRALRPEASVRGLLRQARERAGRGYVAPHRASLLEQMAP
jgi:tetratricopeptide (TPR) repeat protein